MAKGINQKLKILYLLRILWEKTDDLHGITMSEILSSLESYGVSAERKSIYSDIESLNSFGIDITCEKRDRNYYYHLSGRMFELPELKLLVDSVQASKFITEKKSSELIKKIEGMVSKYEASQLQRQVIVSGRNKAMNENIYYNVDNIHTAIGENSKITFRYFQWDIKKNMVFRRNGELYEVSPWALLWDDENYYMVAFDSEEEKIKHFRVDKMLDINIKDEKREGEALFNKLDMASYSNKTFGMFGGEEVTVRLYCDNSLAGVMIDRFGQDIFMVPVDDEHFTVNVSVAMSMQFLAWVFALGEGVKIVGPEAVVSEMREQAERLMRQYRD